MAMNNISEKRKQKMLRITIEIFVFMLLSILMFFKILHYNEYGRCCQMMEFMIWIYSCGLFIMTGICIYINKRKHIKLWKYTLFFILSMLLLTILIIGDTFYYESKATLKHQIPVNDMYLTNKNDPDALEALNEDNDENNNSIFPSPDRLRSAGDINYNVKKYIYYFCDGCVFLNFIRPDDCCEGLSAKTKNVNEYGEVYIYAFNLVMCEKYENLQIYADGWEEKVKKTPPLWKWFLEKIL
jgi:hypothetical protein